MANSFTDSLKQGAPSQQKQAEFAKTLKNREQYLRERAKSERALKENPNKKSWELSSEQKADVKKGTEQVVKKYKGMSQQ